MILAPPPRPALRAAVAVLAPVVAGIGFGGLIGGTAAVVGMALGVVAGLPTAALRAPLPLVAAIALLAMAAIDLGLLIDGRWWLAVVLMLALGLLQWPLNRRAAGIGVMLPALAAVCASVGLPGEPLRISAWSLAGVLLIVTIGRLLGLAAPSEQVRRPVAIRHAAVTALATAAALGAALILEIPHGYWAVVTIALLLRPAPGETRTAVRETTLGTMLGAAVAIGAVIALPSWVVLLLALPCVVAALAWRLAGDQRRYTAYATPLVILVASSGIAAEAVTATVDRLLLTGVGALLAAGLAAWLHRIDEADTADA